LSKEIINFWNQALKNWIAIKPKTEDNGNSPPNLNSVRDSIDLANKVRAAIIGKDVVTIGEESSIASAEQLIKISNEILKSNPTGPSLDLLITFGRLAIKSAIIKLEEKSYAQCPICKCNKSKMWVANIARCVRSHLFYVYIHDEYRLKLVSAIDQGTFKQGDAYILKPGEEIHPGRKTHLPDVNRY
jgi:hypothetical protein